jgi:hypothetical protein
MSLIAFYALVPLLLVQFGLWYSMLDALGEPGWAPIVPLYGVWVITRAAGLYPTVVFFILFYASLFIPFATAAMLGFVTWRIATRSRYGTGFAAFVIAWGLLTGTVLTIIGL